MMKVVQLLLAFLFPPMAVIDRGIRKILIVSVLTFFGWIPGVIAALLILLRNNW